MGKKSFGLLLSRAECLLSRMKTLALGPFQSLNVFANDTKIGGGVNNEKDRSVTQLNWTY